MIHPYDLIGMNYRLGASPEKHNAADCLTLAVAVLTWHGVATPQPQRSWYRRLYRGDTSVFQDELERWGQHLDAPKIGTVALCKSETGLGMASYFETGWIAFKESAVTWSPIDSLLVVELYCPANLIYASS